MTYMSMKSGPHIGVRVQARVWFRGFQWVQVSRHLCCFPCVSVFVTWGDEDVGEDDKARKEETDGLREPPPQVSEHNQSKQFGRKIDSSEDDLHQVDIHLEQPTATRRRAQCEPANRRRRKATTSREVWTV